MGIGDAVVAPDRLRAGRAGAHHLPRRRRRRSSGRRARRRHARAAGHGSVAERARRRSPAISMAQACAGPCSPSPASRRWTPRATGVAAARDAGCDLVIGFGGGSALDAAKAIAALVANGGDPLDYLEVIGAGRPLAAPVAADDRDPDDGRHGIRGDEERGARVRRRRHQGEPAQPADVAAAGDRRSGPAGERARARAGGERPGRAVAAHRAAAVDPRQPRHRRAGARGHPPVGGGAAARARRRPRRRTHRCGRSGSAGAGQRARRPVPRQRRAGRRTRLRRADRRHVRSAARRGVRGAATGGAAGQRARPRRPRAPTARRWHAAASWRRC